jgi:hypothetical protein
MLCLYAGGRENGHKAMKEMSFKYKAHSDKPHFLHNFDRVHR